MSQASAYVRLLLACKKSLKLDRMPTDEEFEGWRGRTYKIHMLKWPPLIETHYKGAGARAIQVECGYDLAQNLKCTHNIAEVTCKLCLSSLAAQHRIGPGKREHMTWQMFDDAVKYITRQVQKYYPRIGYVYGIPRNGIFLAAALAHAGEFELLTDLRTASGYELDEVLVVDDITDTGHTLSKFMGMATAVLYKSNYTPSDNRVDPDIHVYETSWFVQFPWETKQSSKIDYKETK